MPKAVFTSKPSPAYDDLPEQRYHFPQTYLRAVEAALGDWIVYYEPRRPSADLSSTGGRQSYFATARLVRIAEDPRLAKHYYGYVEDYLEFEKPVPFREGSFYYERDLRKADGSTNKGRFGRAVRPLRDIEYQLILQAGFGDFASARERVMEEDPVERERRIVEQISRRPFRDRAFLGRRPHRVRQHLRHHRTPNHQRWRETRGPRGPHQAGRRQRPRQHAQTALALCGTAHWMFDRGLISITDDYTLLLRERAIPGQLHPHHQPERPVDRAESGLAAPASPVSSDTTVSTSSTSTHRNGSTQPSCLFPSPTHRHPTYQRRLTFSSRNPPPYRTTSCYPSPPTWRSTTSRPRAPYASSTPAAPLMPTRSLPPFHSPATAHRTPRAKLPPLAHLHPIPLAFPPSPHPSVPPPSPKRNTSPLTRTLTPIAPLPPPTPPPFPEIGHPCILSLTLRTKNLAPRTTLKRRTQREDWQ